RRRSPATAGRRRAAQRRTGLTERSLGSGVSGAKIRSAHKPRPRASAPSLLGQWRALRIPRVGILLEVSVGELIDRMTILEIKAVELRPALRRAARRELRSLARKKEREVVAVEGLEELTIELRSINRTLWDVEETLRKFENTSSFGVTFVEAARSVYRLNDRRAAVKLAIDRLVGSNREELKSFELPALS